MASPHASSFICLPYSNVSDVLHAYTVYFCTCIGSALIGAVGAIIFLVQVIRNSSRLQSSSSSQKWILIMLGMSDLLADIGKVVFLLTAQLMGLLMYTVYSNAVTSQTSAS